MNSPLKKDRFFPSMNSVFDDLFSKDLFDWNDKNFAAYGTTLPSANIKETSKDVKIDIAVPGMQKEDFQIELDHNVLSVRSEKSNESEEKDKKGNYSRKEFNYQSFYRSFSLPDSVDEEKIAATYQDGILHIEVGKRKEHTLKSTKTIPVK